MERLDALSRGLNRVAESVVAFLVGAMVFVILLQVVFRYVVQSSLSWSEELARYTFVWAIFLGASAATRRGQHIAVDVLALLLPAPVRRALSVFVALVFIGFAGLLVAVGVVLVDAVRFQVSTGLQISISWVYAALPVGAALTLLHLLVGFGGRSAARDASRTR